MTTTPQPEPIDSLIYATVAFGMTPENGYTPDRHQVWMLRRWASACLDEPGVIDGDRQAG